MKSKISIYYTVVFLALLGLMSYVFSVVSSTNQLIAIVTAYLLIVSIAMLSKLDWSSIALSKENLSRGLLFALPIILVIVVCAITMFFINPEIFKDERYQQSSRLVLYTLFITLPIFTVVLEELAFRGILFGMIQTVLSQNYALILSSISFGIWHVFGAGAINISTLPSSIPKIIIVLAVIVATSAAGMFLAWSRIKSGSLLAPILIHWTINASGLVLSYFAWQKQ